MGLNHPKQERKEAARAILHKNREGIAQKGPPKWSNYPLTSIITHFVKFVNTLILNRQGMVHCGIIEVV